MINDIFKSFFRTIGKIMVCLLVGIFIGLSSVAAKDNISLSQCWLGSNTGCNKTFDLSNMQGGSVAIDINNVPSGTLSFHTTLTMNLWNWQSGDSVNVGGGYVVDNTFYSCDSGNSNGCYMKCPVSGTWANCEMWIDTFIAQNDVKVTSLYYLNGNTFNRTFNAIASGSATIDKSTGNVTNGSFNTTINNQTDTIINNQNKNQQETNEKLEQVNDTNKSILDTIKGVFTAIIELPKKLVELLIEGLKSLFIPSDDFFSNKFDELTQNVEKKMGVLAYPLTITIETFQFLLTVEDTGSYIITWPDVVVPNFDFVIISSGSFELSIILENGWINMAHNLYMIFVSTYLLLSFFKFCNNKYSDMFGGDYDNTDYVIVEDSIVDVHDNEDGSKRYVNHKERRYKVGDE